MAILASTLSVDAIVKKGPGESLFENGQDAVSASSTWYQGDLMCFDTSSNILRVVAATTDAVTLVGIADNTVIGGKLLGPYAGLTATDAAEKGPGFAGPKYGVIASLVLKTGDALAVGAKVYLADGLDTKSVSATDPGDHNYIGIYQGPAAISSATAGQKINVLLGARYPAATAAGLVF